MRQSFLLSLFLIVITLFLYFPVCHFDFINLDDDIYVSENPYLQQGFTKESVPWALTAGLFFDSPHADYWQPVTFLSRMLDITMFDFNPSGHHLSNLLIHLMNVLLLFYLFFKATKSTVQSFALALLFAIHPLQTEPVAWITARKDLLSTFFALLSLISYAHETKQNKKTFFLPTAAFFVLGLLSKPSIIVLPFLFLLFDYWPLERMKNLPLKQLISEKIPLFLISLAYIPIPFIGQPQALWQTNPFTTPALYLNYFRKAVCPVGLAIYPPIPTLSTLTVLLTALLFFLVAVLIYKEKNRIHPSLIAGAFFFFIALLPSVNLVPPADRFMYFPLIGLLMIAVYSIPILFSKYSRPICFTIFIATAVFLFVRSSGQLAYWKDSEALFRHALAIHPDHSLAHNNLGFALVKRGALGEGKLHYEEALRINPQNARAHYNLANALIRERKFDEAKPHYVKALELNPNYASAHYNLANLLRKEGKQDEAMFHYTEAFRIDPTFMQKKGRFRNFQY